MKPFVTFTCILSLILLVATSVAVGQSTGTVRGVVKDPSSGVLRQATVVLTNSATPQKTETVTNAGGTYSFAFLPPANKALPRISPDSADSLEKTSTWTSPAWCRSTLLFRSAR